MPCSYGADVLSVSVSVVASADDDPSPVLVDSVVTVPSGFVVTDDEDSQSPEHELDELLEADDDEELEINGGLFEVTVTTSGSTTFGGTSVATSGGPGVSVTTGTSGMTSGISTSEISGTPEISSRIFDRRSRSRPRAFSTRSLAFSRRSFARLPLILRSSWRSELAGSCSV